MVRLETVFSTYTLAAGTAAWICRSLVACLMFVTFDVFSPDSGGGV